MASGDLIKSNVDPDSLPMGAVLTPSGRVSAARFPGDVPTTPPFHTDELVALDEALADATDETGIRFSVFIGDLGEDAFAGASAILPSAPEPEHAVLIADCSQHQRRGGRLRKRGGCPPQRPGGATRCDCCHRRNPFRRSRRRHHLCDPRHRSSGDHSLISSTPEKRRGDLSVTPPFSIGSALVELACP